MTSPLNHIHIILVETTLPANIGSAARAMKTMGLTNLHVVKPKHPLDDDALAHAAGAKDILQAIQYHETLADALAQSHIVWAASSRQRAMPQPTLSVKQACEHLPQLFNTNNTQLPQLSIVFGREDRGLTNAELALANYHVMIPANDDYGVLNLAQAVQVFSYEIRQALLLIDARPPTNQATNQTNKQLNQQLNLAIRTEWDESLATHEQLLLLETALLELMKQANVYDETNPRKTPERIKRLLSRTQLDTMEYNLIRALIRKLANSQ